MLIALLVSMLFAGLIFLYIVTNDNTRKSNEESISWIIANMDEIVDELSYRGYHFEIVKFPVDTEGTTSIRFSTINKALDGVKPGVFAKLYKAKKFVELHKKCSDINDKAGGTLRYRTLL